MKPLSFLLSLMCYGTLESCAFSKDNVAGREVFQRIEISNEGHQAVSGASVLYGTTQLISGPAREKYPVPNPVRYNYSQGLDSPIPDQTKIHWTTDDGIVHDEIVPTRSLVPDVATFYGFRFFFANDHVNVYLTERRPNPSGALSLKYTKVYPLH